MLAVHETRVAKESREEINLDHQNILILKSQQFGYLKQVTEQEINQKKANYT